MAGGDEEEDYMADISLFLPPEDNSSSKKKFTSKSNEPPFAPKLKRPKTLSWQEHRKLENERKQREEDEKTKARLDAAIPESNLGFRMLRQMGYKPGTALGKEGCGMAEPVGLEIRRSRAGIGRETPEEEAARKEKEAARKEKEAAERLRVREQDMVAEFGSRQRTQWREKKVAGDYRKAEAALAQLENKEVLEAKKEEEEEEDDEKEQAEAQEEVLITEEDLREILMKLREEHYYCLYCGFQYVSEAALQSSCPGLHEEDH